MAQPNGESDGSPRVEASSVPDQITQSLLKHVSHVARECRAKAVFVYADALNPHTQTLCANADPPFYFVTQTVAEDHEQQRRGVQFIHVPDVPLSRLGRLKIAVFLAVAKGLVSQGDIVAGISGPPDSGTLDTLIITQVGREFELFAPEGQWLPPNVRPEVIATVLEIASSLGSEGREGKPVGALFVIGQSEQVLGMSRQLILNPFRGYPEVERNVLDPALAETLKELSAVDGAFIVRGDGVVETGGALLKIAGQHEYELPRGLGARHHAAAAITAVTDSVAIALSESTGTVTVFRSGRILTEIERSRNLGRPRSMLRHAGDD